MLAKTSDKRDVNKQKKYVRTTLAVFGSPFYIRVYYSHYTLPALAVGFFNASLQRHIPV